MGMDSYLGSYIDALSSEIRQFAQTTYQQETVHTIYFGGGTPTIMPASSFEKILDVISQNYHLIEKPEITTEANPLYLPAEYLTDLRNLGINRLSMGMQSADPADLKLLGRRHTTEDVVRSVANARQAGLKDVNLDLIFGIPGQVCCHSNIPLKKRCRSIRNISRSIH
jgi:oxygen-independent coproporphyrinogen-3 oxidase